jgi:iron complex transport system ATP-binding protein
MLKTSSLHYKIQDKILLKEITMHLKKGGNLTIMGANGAGKSTLAKLLCGLIESKKQIELQDQYIEDIQGENRAKYINYMPSKFSIYDNYITVRDYLDLSLYESTPKEKDAKEILSKLGLSAYHDSLVNTLSSGEQQLLLLASCMIQNATITLLDEPTSNLDPKKTKVVFDILSSSTYLPSKILISHDLQLAYKLNFPILYIEKGEGITFQKDFFNKKNLLHYFGDTIKIVDNNIVEAL